MKIDVGSGNTTAIEQFIESFNVPISAAYSPIGQSLQAVSQYGLITDPSTMNHVILIVDGYQYCDIGSGIACATAADCTLMGVASCPTCSPYPPDSCYCVQNWPALGAAALSTMSVKTHVVGLGPDTYPRSLNQTADAGGTAFSGCDPTSSLSSCYYQADTLPQLMTALQTIVQEIITDSCTRATP